MGHDHPMIYLTAKLAELTDELFAVTRHGALRWELGEGEGRYLARVGTLEVRLHPVTGRDGLPGLAIELVNAQGRIVQRYSDHDLSDHEPRDDEHRTYWDVLTELHELARWSAEGILELIDTLMHGLQPAEIPASDVPRIDADLHRVELGWSGHAETRRLTRVGMR